MGKHTGRKISLHSNLGHAELSAIFNGPVASVEEAAPSQQAQVESGTPSSLAGAAASHRFSANSTSSLASGSANSGLPGSPGISDAAPMRKYILMVSTFQMVILMLFNQRNRYTFSELLVESGIPERDLLRNLMALCMSKSTQRILCKEPKASAVNKEIEPTDVFCVNNSFFSRLHKVKVSHYCLASSLYELRRKIKGLNFREFLMVLVLGGFRTLDVLVQRNFKS